MLRLQIETSLHWPLGSAAGGCQKRGITHLLPAGWKNPRERWGSPVRIDNEAEIPKMRGIWKHARRHNAPIQACCDQPHGEGGDGWITPCHRKKKEVSNGNSGCSGYSRFEFRSLALWVLSN
ncbi:hypothetical protein [Xanthomonas sp. 60]